MGLEYSVEPARNGWDIVERGEVLATKAGFDEALAFAEFLVLVARASGCEATLSVDGELRNLDLGWPSDSSVADHSTGSPPPPSARAVDRLSRAR